MKVFVPSLEIGNFASVVRMVQRAGGEARLIESPRALREADRIVLAGVGAFDNGMRSLQEGGWIEELNLAVLENRTPVLGICLGMQLMCEGSEEGRLPGLAWIAGHARRFVASNEERLKVPHMGWNVVAALRSNPLLPPDDAEQRFYFVHSYHVECRDRRDVLAVSSHGKEFVAAVGRDNLFGVQFHPEKSHRFGLALLSRFVSLPC